MRSTEKSKTRQKGLRICYFATQQNMLLAAQNVTVGQLIIFSLSFGFKRCEIWTDRAYVQTHHPNKNFSLTEFHLKDRSAYKSRVQRVVCPVAGITRRKTKS